MTHDESSLSTGLPDLDRVLRGIMAGDNVVWRVSSIEEYQPFVESYSAYARRKGRRLIYFRFAKHEPLLGELSGLETKYLQLGQGFEPLVTAIQNVIEKNEPGTYYLFDCLSDLAVDWSSDRMLGNFFMLICPYILDHRGFAYFSILRNFHSFHTIRPITRTAQVVIDSYHHKQTLYIRPRKVERRHSATMFMLHAWDGNNFCPVSDSGINTEVLADLPWNRQDGSSHRLGFWGTAFTKAEEVYAMLQQGEQPGEDEQPVVNQLLLMLVGNERRIFKIAQKHLELSDLLDIRRRLIGTGQVGGKSVGMILAQAILRKADPSWAALLEHHDSFYIGADVFYTYLVQNGLWWIKQRQKDPDTFLDGLELARQQMRNGSFPDYIMEQFADLLDYFGQSPIVVRSSSLLEDSYDSAFAGKAQSVFCINQGSREERMEDFVSAVKTVYASEMSEDALKYRSSLGLLGRDEQMSILVQRISGRAYGRKFFPHIAGVGLSFNPYVWSEHIDPDAGVLRLVFGLGTRAVDTSVEDFTRIIALNAPERQVVDSPHAARKRVQRKMDLLDLESHKHVSSGFTDVASQCSDLPLDLFASHDSKAASFAAERGKKNVFPWLLTFEKLIKQTSFVERTRQMLSILQEAYGQPVDIEFAANFSPDGTYTINLIQCRPMLVKSKGIDAELPAGLTDEDRIIDSRGPVIGLSREIMVDRIIYVLPSAYGQLEHKNRYAVAKLIGQLTGIDAAGTDRRTLLLGPGRWGSTEPFLGVPVSFTEIKTVCAVCEVVTMREGLTPDVSLGTHFFNELVETDILYFALYPDRESDFLNGNLLEDAPNKLLELLPEAARWANVVRVLDPLEWNDGKALRLNASATKQRVVCYLK